MSKYLINVTEVYRVDTIAEAEQLHEEMKKDTKSNLLSFGYKYKCLKQKGDIVEEWYLATAKKEFNNEKEPEYDVSITYEVWG